MKNENYVTLGQIAKYVESKTGIAYKVHKGSEFGFAFNGNCVMLAPKSWGNLNCTAGVGENASDVREMIGKYLEFLGTKIDPEKNQVRGREAVISTDDSKVLAMIIPTNEELMIARDTVEILSK